ncbi:hypothetical protein K438DRAFT_1779098 [Mycena galopus ATCC 62051]|nr:hypothetical protein K438DRAFT_1779098 [Mycena galopus ATCC 62051]
MTSQRAAPPLSAHPPLQFLARANQVIKITQAAKETASQCKSPQFCSLPNFMILLESSSVAQARVPRLSHPKNQVDGRPVLEPAYLEVIDQDGKDLALAIHGRTASRKLIERLPVEPIGGQKRARAEGGREVANGVELASTLAAHVHSRHTPLIAPLSSATRRNESALALLVDHVVAVRTVAYAEMTRTTLLDAEKR